MVIANSDSNNTLVSLEDDNKYYQEQRYGVSPISVIDTGVHHRDLRRTRLHLRTLEQQQDTVLDLPEQLDSSNNVDEYLACMPEVVTSCKDMLSCKPVEYSTDSAERVLYVGQGEIGHAVPLQADVLVSDRATTCHILAMHSQSNSDLPPLATLTHLDGTMYSTCIREAVEEHVDYHDEPFQLDMHIVGGFCDEKQASAGITNWLFHLFADLADEYAGLVQFCIKTCAVTSLNNYTDLDDFDSPIGRGLAINVHTGSVHLARCTGVTGPAATLRSVRLWACQDRGLSCVHHHTTSSIVTVEPFTFKPFASLDALLALPDHLMIRYTSTSPECEEADFCTSVRSTLLFMRNVSCRQVFSSNTPLVYKRIGDSNEWKLVQ